MSEEFVSSVIVAVPMRGDDEEYVGYVDISSDDTEIQVFSSFGREGTYVEVCIYKIDPALYRKAKPWIGDVMNVWIRDVRRGRVSFVITDIRYQDTNGDENWRLEITGEAPLYYILSHCEMNGTVDLGKSTDYGNAIAKVIGRGLEQNGIVDEEFRVIYNEEKARKVFDSLSCFNEPVARVIDNIAHEMCLEYYYSPFASELYIGAPTPSDENNDIAGVEALAATGHHCRYGVKGPDGNIIDVYDVVMPGSLIILPGAMVMMGDGYYYKAVEASYYARGNNEREQHVKLVRSDVICDDVFMALLNDQPIHSSFPEVGDVVKVADVFPNDEDAKDMSHGKYRAFIAPKDSSKQDSGSWDMDDEILMAPLTRTTPYAGDGVGLLFPQAEKSRALIFHPNKHHNIGYVGQMTWKEGKDPQQVPEKEDDDFLLRLKEAELYFDASQKCWLLRGSKVVIHADDPAAASSKPSLTAGTAYITIQSDGNVVIEGATIKLGEGAAKFVALADHTHDLTTTICPSSGSPVTGSLGASNSNSTKAKAE